MTPAAGLLILASGVAAAAGDDHPPASAGDDAVQEVVILGETRPVLLRFRIAVGGKPFRAAWDDSVRALHARLDRDGDGKLTTQEAEAGDLAALVAADGNAPAARPRVEVDVSPKDGVVSVDELAEALRPAAGPFRVRVGRVADGRTDALFDQIDRDKDGLLTGPELAAVAGTLRRLDLDDDESIGEDEVAPAAAPAAMMPGSMAARPSRATAAPPAVELVAGDPPLRAARLLIKKYDTASRRGPGTTDSRLAAEEFAVAPASFAAADSNGDGMLNVDEVRRYLADAPRDAVLDVLLTPDASGRASARVAADAGPTPAGVGVRQHAEGVVGVDVGPTRLDIRADDGAAAEALARRASTAQFRALDANQDGYLEESELALANGQPSPLAARFKALDRDGDGKLYPKELEADAELRALAARGRLALTASDRGRALFGLLDADRDGRVGAREVLEAPGRLLSCDRDGDGRVAADEVPQQIQLTLGRGDLAGPAAASQAARAAGPAWFRKMDRNGDGDVSRREFLGSRSQFDRLDRDRDGLVGPAEAEAAGKAPGG